MAEITQAICLHRKREAIDGPASELANARGLVASLR